MIKLFCLFCFVEQEIETMLEELNQLSNTGVLLLVNTKLLRVDIEVMCARRDCRLVDSVHMQDILLKSVFCYFLTNFKR